MVERGPDFVGLWPKSVEVKPDLIEARPTLAQARPRLVKPPRRVPTNADTLGPESTNLCGRARLQTLKMRGLPSP